MKLIYKNFYFCAFFILFQFDTKSCSENCQKCIKNCCSTNEKVGFFEKILDPKLKVEKKEIKEFVEEFVVKNKKPKENYKNKTEHIPRILWTLPYCFIVSALNALFSLDNVLDFFSKEDNINVKKDNKNTSNLLLHEESNKGNNKQKEEEIKRYKIFYILHYIVQFLNENRENHIEIKDKLGKVLCTLVDNKNYKREISGGNPYPFFEYISLNFIPIFPLRNIYQSLGVKSDIYYKFYNDEWVLEKGPLMPQESIIFIYVTNKKNSGDSLKQKDYDKLNIQKEIEFNGNKYILKSVIYFFSHIDGQFEENKSNDYGGFYRGGIHNYDNNNAKSFYFLQFNKVKKYNDKGVDIKEIKWETYTKYIFRAPIFLFYEKLKKKSNLLDI